MITGKDIYDVLAAIVPLYVAMFLAYGSVRWWGIFSPDQCSGINRFVAVFAVPLLSFHFISSNNIYAMDFRFLAADSLQKVVILSALCIWQTFSKRASSDWMITLFSLSTLPNTLVMGIPLLSAMYGPFSGDLMVQIVVLQSVIWYTLMLFMFEYRGAKLLIGEQFPETAASITSFKVESDVISLNGREPLQTDAEIGDDGRLHVVVKRSNTPSLASSRSNYYNYNKQSSRGNNHINSLASMNMTPRASNLTGVEIYSVQSSREPTPRGSSFNQNDFYAMFSSSKAASPKHGYTSSYGGGAEVYSLQSSKVATPRTSNFEEEMMTTNKNSNNNKNKKGGGRSMSGELFNNGGFSYPPPNPMLFGGSSTTTAGGLKKKEGGGGGSNNKDLHMFVWSSSASSPVSEGHVRNAVIHRAASTDFAVVDASKAALRREFAPASASIKGTSEFGEKNNNNSPGRKAASEDKLDQGDIEEAAGTSSKLGPVSGSLPYTNTNQKKVEETEDEEEEEEAEGGNNKNHQMPPASVMTRLILIMVWRKLIRNPNTYSSLAGVIWSLISFRYNIQMPAIVHGSIAILSDAGLGMAMFSLGLFMALQPRIIACGKSVATFSMAVRFLTGPAVIAATSIAVGLRGVLLHVAIVQAALPQGIVPFVFAKEYNVHPDILSTAVIFGMLVALPVTILYYVLLGL